MKAKTQVKAGADRPRKGGFVVFVEDENGEMIFLGSRRRL